MTRVEENKEQIENLLNKEEQLLSNPFSGTFESAMVLKTTLIASLLIDISKSLAIKADAAVEANKLKKNMDGVPPTVTPQEPCEDAVSREFLLRDLLLKAQGEKDVNIKWLEEYINSLPPVTSTHGTCKDCKHFWCIEDCRSMKVCSKHGAMRISKSFYCKDFEPKEREK